MGEWCQWCSSGVFIVTHFTLFSSFGCHSEQVYVFWGHNLLGKVLLLLPSAILTFGQITRLIGFSSVEEKSNSFWMHHNSKIIVIPSEVLPDVSSHTTSPVHLNLLMPLVAFHTPWKQIKKEGFLMLSAVAKRDQCHEIYYRKRPIEPSERSFKKQKLLHGCLLWLGTS